MARNQTELAGIEAPKIPEIEKAADAYVKVRDKRMKLTEDEITLKGSLLQAMQKHHENLSVDAEGNRTYRFDEEVVILQPGKLNVKVKRAEDPTSDED